MKYGSIPAGGLGTRLQPLGFSKELAPVGGLAVIEHLIKRMLTSGINKIFISTASDKTDLITYLATKSSYFKHLIFLVRPRRGLLDGIVLPEQFLREDDQLYFGLPDTIWYPQDGFTQLDKVDGGLVLGLFDTGTPQLFDNVKLGANNQIKSIQVKSKTPVSPWTWGIGKMSVVTARALRIYETQLGAKPLFGQALHLYCQDHLGYGVPLPYSHYLDIGTPANYLAAETFLKQYDHL